MKRSLFVLLISMFLLSACINAPIVQETTAIDSSMIITDALNRQVSLPNPPKRIVITGKALIMVVDAVYMFPEAPGRIAALANIGQGDNNFISLIDPNYAAKAILLRDAGAEQIAASKPDLVILKSSLAETLGKSLDVLKIPVIYVDFETPDQYYRDIEILGKVFQNEARASELVNFYKSKLETIQSAVQGVSSKPKVLMLYYNDRDGVVAFNVPPMNWMQTRIVDLAGGVPVWADANPGEGWAKVTLEQIAAWDADDIFIISYIKDPSEIVKNLKEDPQWQSIPAVKQNRLYAFPGDLYSWDQPDSRWILGLSWLAEQLHPDCFPQFDIVQEAQQFYETLYGLDTKFFEDKIQPTFRGDLP